jgi:hypothetical protein
MQAHLCVERHIRHVHSFDQALASMPISPDIPEPPSRQEPVFRSDRSSYRVGYRFLHNGLGAMFTREQILGSDPPGDLLRLR